MVFAGPIGGGKTFIAFGLAAELKMPVILLKNFRQMYYGRSDIVIESLYRVLRSLHKAMIVIDEADTQFGSRIGIIKSPARPGRRISADSL
jgi:AAA+ superfamily predicted ATPase